MIALAGEQELVLEDNAGVEILRLVRQLDQGVVQLSVFQPGEQRGRLLL